VKTLLEATTVALSTEVVWEGQAARDRSNQSPHLMQGKFPMELAQMGACHDINILFSLYL